MHDRFFFPVAALICLAMVIGAFAPYVARPEPAPIEGRVVGNAVLFDAAALNRTFGSKETPVTQGPRAGGQLGLRMISRGPRLGGGRAAILVLGPETSRTIAGRRIELTISGRQIRDYGSKALGVSMGGGAYTLTPPLGAGFSDVKVVLDAPRDANSLRFWPDLNGEDRGVEIKSVSMKVLS